MDADEIMRLMRVIRAKGHTSAYTPRTRDELEALGAKGMPGVPVTEYDPKEHKVLACTVIAPGEMLTLPDNRTGPCAWRCGRTVQFRPWVPPELQTVCLYCLSEREKDDN
jgi:hypothetical protein